MNEYSGYLSRKLPQENELYQPKVNMRFYRSIADKLRFTACF